MSLEYNYDLGLTAFLSSQEKQIQQSYRPIIGVHKWFARRPGALFRGLILSEFADAPLRETYFEPNDFRGVVLDPFMGGGTPLFEAVRVGLNVVGCDVNPMSRWIVERELEAIDVEELRTWGAHVAQQAATSVERFYETDCSCGGRVPVKYFLWVKVLPCSSCGSPNRLFPGHVVASHGRHHRDVLVCPQCSALTEFEPGSKNLACSACAAPIPREGLARRNKFLCACCGWENRYPPTDQDGPPRHELFAMEYHCPDCKIRLGGRFYKAPDETDLALFARATRLCDDLDSPYWPSDRIPDGDETRRLHRWGYDFYRDLFGSRQLLSLHYIAEAVASIPKSDIRRALATVFSDFLRYQNLLCRYDTMALKCQDIFSVHGYPVGLLQCENNALGIPGIGGGGWNHFVQKYITAKEYCLRPFETEVTTKRRRKVTTDGERIAAQIVRDPNRVSTGSRKALLHLGSVATLELPPESVDAVFTDPPYYDNVQYAELIDFCYVWLRRLYTSALFTSGSTRSTQELTGNQTESRGLTGFAVGLGEVFGACARALKPGGLFAFTYHHNDLGAYAAVALALLAADLVPTEALICPAEMKASLHIHGTESSTMDTVFVCRKPPAVDATEFATAEFGEYQVAQLLSAGLRIRPGDLRCMALGIATARVVQARRKIDGLDLEPDELIVELTNEIEKEFGEIHPQLCTAAGGEENAGSQMSIVLGSS